MFGLEKEKKKAQKFDFDLEVEIHEDPDKAKQLIELSDKRIEEIKALLKDGDNENDFDHYGVLLHGYAALARVLKKVAKETPKKK